MIEAEAFKKWVISKNDYTERVCSNIVSRAKRADKILEWTNEKTYIFYLEQEEGFINLTYSVKSQIRKAVKLYAEFKGVKFKKTKKSQ